MAPYEGVSMDGVTFVILVDSPPLMADGNWKVGVVVDQNTSDEQMNALGTLMSGEIGGPPAMLKDLIGEMLGMENGKNRQNLMIFSKDVIEVAAP